MGSKINFWLGFRWLNSRLIYIGEAYSNTIQRRVLVRCDCGQIKDIQLTSLQDGSTISCGCYRSEQTTIKASTQKGQSKHWLFSRWRSMLDRCYRRTHSHYNCYGAKGITVCPLWHNFEKYALWVENVEGMAPQFDFEIHREDAAKNYGPKNCICLPTAEHRAIELERRRLKNVSV